MPRSRMIKEGGLPEGPHHRSRGPRRHHMPLVEDTLDARNRRISITVLRQ